MTRAFNKRCACGKSYTLREWLDLPLKGIQRWDDDVLEPPHEVRQCTSCQSTIHVVLSLVRGGDHADCGGQRA